MAHESTEVPQNEGSSVAGHKRPTWQTALVIIASAALGGWAGAVWHRRALQQIRDSADAPLPRNLDLDDDAIF